MTPDPFSPPIQTGGPGLPPPVDPAATSVPRVNVGGAFSDRERLLRERDTREKELAKARETMGTGSPSMERELQPLAEREKDAWTQLEELHAPVSEAAQMHFKPTPPIDANDYQHFSTLLLSLAMLGGVASRGNWLGVSASFNGALDGYIEGNRERAKKSFEDYQTRFNEALAHDKAAQKEFEDARNNLNFTIQEMIREEQQIAAKYQRQDMLLAARDKSIDRMDQNIASIDRTLEQASAADARVQSQMQIALMRQKMMGGGVNYLNSYGKWAIDTLAGSGNTKPLQTVMSRYGGAFAATVWNDVAKEWWEEGLDPRTFTVEQANITVQTAVQRQTSQRLAAVNRLTSTVQQMEKEMMRVTARVNGTNPNLANKFFNSFVGDTLGAGKEAVDISELTTVAAAVGRQYMEVVTMPGSNAQMHWGAQEFANKLINRDYNLNTMLGAVKGINLEIQAGHKALDDTIKQSKQDLLTQGMNFPAPAAAPEQPLGDFKIEKVP